MSVDLEKHWYLLPALSGTLLIASFHPYNVWPLSFVALVPLYYFIAAHPHFSYRRIFLGGAITGGLFAFSLSYFTVVQFHWLPETYIFSAAVQLSAIPIALFSAILTGTFVLAYKLRSSSLFLNALLGAAVYTAAEFLLQAFFGGYYLATLAYAAAPLSPLLSLAALGGAPLLSFFVAWINGLIAETLVAGRARVWNMAAALAVMVVLFVPHYFYLHRPLPVERTIRVSVVQAGAREHIVFGTQTEEKFSWDAEESLARAAASSPDLLIYPFSPVEGALYRGEPPVFNKKVLVADEAAVGHFFADVLPAGTALLTWNNVYAEGNFYNAYQLWQEGKVVSEYHKRKLFPFMDYTPRWAQRIGLYSTPFDVKAGAADNRLVVQGIPLGDLMCSELHDPGLARTEARQTPLILAVGSEAMFYDDVASAFSLRAAQLRAAENNVPVVRGNILGPSAIIDQFGVVQASAPAGERTVVEGEVALRAASRTLYNRFGNSLVILFLGAVLAGAYMKRIRENLN